MASGDTLLTIGAWDWDPPGANYATIDVRPDDNSDPHRVLDFDASTNEGAIAGRVMPQIYDGGGVTVYIHYSMSSAVADTVDWDFQFERIGDQQQDVDAASWAAVNSVDNTTVPGTSGLVDVVTIAFTDGADMDSVAKGEAFRCRIIRDATNDDATGDAELHHVEIRET